MPPKLKSFLRLSVETFLVLLLIHLALPALFLALQIPAFSVGLVDTWILRWQNDASGSGIQFNVLFLLGVALLVGLILGLMKSRRKVS